ncbi:MAG: hypothetical protein IJA43_01110 [Clostridia bacterium]|nr:hypothetical protein [Clostridia bacterium]
MKKNRVLLLIISVIVLVLEILPCGAVCNFANPDEEPIKTTYSYFDLTPFGYANFGPFITAILTCILVILSIVYLLNLNKNFTRIMSIISGVSVLSSILPIMYGASYISVVGVIITILLVSYFLVIVSTNKVK